MSILDNPTCKPVIIIAGLSYLASVLVSDLVFDLLGNSEFTRLYYCTLKPAVQADWSRTLPLAVAVIITAIGLTLKIKESYRLNSDLFIFELSKIAAMIVVCVPLYFKLIQLVNLGCSTMDAETGPWGVHKNLLMSHMCVLLILIGTIVAEFAILMNFTPGTGSKPIRKPRN